MNITLVMLITAIFLKAGEWGENKFNYNKDVNLPSPSIKIDDSSSRYAQDSGFTTEVAGEDEDVFDPTLPSTPPPREIDIVKPDAVEENAMEEKLKKSRGFEEDFSITDYSQIKYLEIISKNCREQNFDLELALAIIKKESNFNPYIKSKVGAIGLMQLMPDTARWLGLKNVSKLKDPDVNVKYGIKYLRYLFNMFADDVDYARLEKEDIKNIKVLRVLAAYNAGPGNVEKYINPPHNGIPPYKETRVYVSKVPVYFTKFKDLAISR